MHDWLNSISILLILAGILVQSRTINRLRGLYRAGRAAGQLIAANNLSKAGYDDKAFLIAIGKQKAEKNDS